MAGPPDGNSWDVLIAGAGLAGASLAIRLAQKGLRVAVLDAAAFPRPKLCGEFLSPEAWIALDRLGLTDEVMGSGFEPIRRTRLTTPRGRILDAEVTGPDGRPGIALSRDVLDAILVDGARRAGATVIERARVSGPLMRDKSVIGLTARVGGEGPTAFHARLTVAADGRHSALVRRTGRTRGRSWFRPPLFGLKRHLAVRDPALDEEAGTVALHLLPGGYVGTCRAEEGITNLCGLLPESLASRHRGNLDGLAREEFPRNPHLGRLWEAAEPRGEWKAVAGVRVERSSPTFDGILYAGDCQGTVDPLGGQGMTMALLGTETLAGIITKGLSRGGVDRAVQAEWSRAWHARFDRRIRLCRLFHHILLNPWLIDTASLGSGAGARLLRLGYHLTREPGIA